eukprot:5186375-Amphidinium_carterae.2
METQLAHRNFNAWSRRQAKATLWRIFWLPWMSLPAISSPSLMRPQVGEMYLAGPTVFPGYIGEHGLSGNDPGVLRVGLRGFKGGLEGGIGMKPQLEAARPGIQDEHREIRNIASPLSL